METLWQDLRYGFRMLARNPGFTTVAVLTLALGIGANTAIFSVVNAVLLRPLPYDNPGRLLLLSGNNELRGWSGVSLPPGAYFAFGSQTQTLEGLAGYSEKSFTLTGGEEPLRITGAQATANLFPLLGIQAERGRAFLPNEDKPAAPEVAVLSHGLWQRYFGGDPEITGKTITLDEKTYTIVGVMPSQFHFPSPQTEVWLPLNLDSSQPLWGNWFVHGIGRLKKNVPLVQAQAEIETLTRTFSDNLPFGGRWVFRFSSLADKVVGEVRPALLILLGTVGLVLLIACANVASLLLSQADGRQKEFALRAALGATRPRLVGQLLTENLLLSILGGAAGLLLSGWGIDILMAFIPEDFPRLAEINFDGWVLVFTLVLAVLTGLLSGLLPALQSSRIGLVETLKDGGRSSASGSARSWARESLVVAELALSIVLLVGAGLLVRSFVRLMQVDAGFETRNVITMRLSLPLSRYADSRQQAEFIRQLIESASNLPAIRSLGVTTGLPTRDVSGMDTSLKIEGRAQEAVENQQMVAIDSVTPDYFRSVGIPLQQGRLFTSHDARSATKVAIINEAIVRRYFPNQDPIGKRIYHTNDEDLMTIVGVVASVRQFGLDEDTPLQMYFPFAQEPQRSFYLMIQTTDRPDTPVADLKSLIWSLDPALPVTQIQTLEQVVTASVAQRRFNMFLMSCFGVLALVLAAVGIYGVISYSVSRRTHEIGIRMALGAQPRDIFRLVVGQGMVLVLIGVAVGLVGAFALTRFLESMLFGVSATDPVTFAGVALLLAAVALLACYIPARRATKVDPLVALRYE